MAILVMEGLWHAMTTPSWVCRFGAKENIFRPMITGLGRAASRAIGPRAPNIPWIDLGRTRGSKPQMVGIIGIPFWTNPRDGFSTGGSAKTKRVKPSMAGMAYPFFDAGAPKSIGDSTISLIITEVRRDRWTLHKRSRKYSSPWYYCLAMQLLLCTTYLSIQLVPWLAKLWTCALSTLQSNRACRSPLWQNEQISQSNPSASMFSRTMWLS